MNAPRQPASDRLCRFLPTTRGEMRARGWSELDILLISGDGYVDHPAFGVSVIGRWLEHHGFRVGVIAQPDWHSPEQLLRLGRPRLFVGVTAGNLDSLLNEFTSQHKRRSEDPYSPGGRPGQRPSRATIVYANLCRQLMSSVPVVIGGIEASLRRLAHYDYWSDRVRRSVLLDTGAQLLVYGMGERPILEIAKRLAAGQKVDEIRDVRGTGFVLRKGQWAHLTDPESRVHDRPLVLPSFERVSASKEAFADMTRLAHRETNPANARPLLQPHKSTAVYLNPPALPLEPTELDLIHELPYARAPHWSYREAIPALAPVRHSITVVRGCFGGCSFCSLTAHQGRSIQSRSTASVLREVEQLARGEDFRGTITDLGGPTANMYGLACRDEKAAAACRRLSCIYPRICSRLLTDHRRFLSLLRQVAQHRAVKHAYVASGVRHDLALCSSEFISALARHYTGGQLSVAPEHISSEVLERMKKPSSQCYERFVTAFGRASEQADKRQYVVPYFMSGHPGSTLGDMIKLARYLKRKGWRPRQVQQFIPTPMSVASAMY